MRMNPFAFGILVVALFAGSIGVAMAAGVWQSTGRSGAGMGAEAGSGAEDGSNAEAGAGEGQGAGRTMPATITDPVSIKGWMAIGDVAEAAGVDLGEILAAFDLPADTPPATELKELESDAFSVSALRAWLAERAAAPTPGD